MLFVAPSPIVAHSAQHTTTRAHIQRVSFTAAAAMTNRATTAAVVVVVARGRDVPPRRLFSSRRVFHFRSRQRRISGEANDDARLLSLRAAAAETESPAPSTKLPSVDEVDEKNEFTKLMEEAGVKHQVRLASGKRGRGLFPTGLVGWSQSDILLSVPLDICIAAPFGDEDAIKTEFKADRSKDTLVILRRAWEARNKVKIPMAITILLESPSGDDRELAIALWLVWATKAGGEVWRSYAEWLPQPGNMPSLLLADDKELEQLQDESLAAEARVLQARIAAAYDRLPAVNATATEMAGAPVPVRRRRPPGGGNGSMAPHQQRAARTLPLLCSAVSCYDGLHSCCTKTFFLYPQDVYV